MKLPKQVIQHAQCMMRRDVQDGATLAQAHDTWMINLKYKYIAEKRKAAQYGFIPESRDGTYQGPSIHKRKSAGAEGRIKKHVLHKSVQGGYVT